MELFLSFLSLRSIVYYSVTVNAEHSLPSYVAYSSNCLQKGLFSVRGPSIKDVGIFLAIFDTPLPHVGILTLIYLTSTF